MLQPATWCTAEMHVPARLAPRLTQQRDERGQVLND